MQVLESSNNAMAFILEPFRLTWHILAITDGMTSRVPGFVCGTGLRSLTKVGPR
jgi:hypothetical protein